MENRIILYHGSKKIIDSPQFGVGNIHNDYGLGFYCTKHKDLAAEWSVAEHRDGFINCYELDTNGLNVLNITNGDYNILNWLAILLKNRTFRLNSYLMIQGKEYLLEKFLPDYEKYDVIRGYRADDSYFSFAVGFLNNSISLQQLEKVMALGNLGEQIVLKSQESFDRISFTSYDIALENVYFPRKFNRDKKAREAFLGERKLSPQGYYMMDILRERWENEDERLRRIILR